MHAVLCHISLPNNAEQMSIKKGSVAIKFLET